MRAARSRAYGFTLLELAVVVAAIAILAGVALDRVLPLIGRAQRAAFVRVRADLQSALFLEAANRITRGEADTLPELATENPMSLLLKPPANYLGPVDPRSDRDIPRGSWYYDERAGRLAYRVGRYTRFSTKEEPGDLIELTVAFAYQDQDRDGVFDAARDRLDGLTLESVRDYEWPD
jgi:prepilin-type N-terminal cleavage/methylation domain-containing protein